MHLILLHAFPLDRRMWNGQLDILPTATSAPTLYPLGDSMRTWAKRVLDEAPNVPLVVVGCSMGGCCALEMARLAADRIAALVLIGTKAGHRPEPDMRDRYIAELRDGGAARVWPTLVHRFFGPSAPTSAVKAAEAMALDQNPDDLVRAVEVFHGRPDATDVVRNWGKPLAVIAGEVDGVVSGGTLTAMAKAAPHGSFTS